MNKPEEQPRAIVAGHGDFARGLVSAVAQITGRDDCFITLSNRDCSAAELEERILSLVESEGVKVVFTDLPAGSCTVAARKVVRLRSDVVLVTGANVAALLDFAFQSGVPAREAAGHAGEKARAAIQVHGAQEG
jgi:N-acetylgalactosamine PTS system EIIA component